jgi:hypothetical protein
MSVGTTDERETETERPRDSDCLSFSSNFSTFHSPTTAQIVQAISPSFHDTSASAAEAEKAAEAATEALAVRSNTPVNQHTPISLMIPLGILQQPTITDAYNPTPSVLGRPSWTSYGTNETLPRYAERGLPGRVSLYG